MRITVVSPYDPFPEESKDGGAHIGGVERVLAEVSLCLHRRGHDVTVVCSSERRDGTEPDGLRVVRVRRRGTIMRAPLARLAAHIPVDADIVHVPATYPFITPAVLRKARRLGVPCVLDFHFEPEPGSAIGRLAAAVYRRLGPRAYPLADAVLVRSEAYARRSPSLGAVPSRLRHVLPNGIDPERFHPGLDPGRDAPLLFVGRLVPYKGLEVLLDALSRLSRPPPLWVVGDGPLRGALEARARARGVNVVFHGRVPDHALPDYYRRARLTVLPSVTRQECFGISLIESMACGTPVVASSLPGVGDVAALGGSTATPGDAEAWARALVLAIQQDGPRGEHLAESIHGQYSWDAITDRLLGIYERILRDTPVYVHEDPRRHTIL